MDKIKRGHIQALASLLTNIQIPNFFKGRIYTGPLKKICTPGLNCYSCPGALGSCPIGAFQAVIGSPTYKFSYYIFAMVSIFGLAVGRLICGFLCPFGWFEDLLYKIPSKKFSTKRLKFLRYLKYFILIFVVGLMGVIFVDKIGMSTPYFCKYICPQGILQGAIPLSLVNPSIRAALGPLFTWKAFILLSIIALSIIFYRPFCKWICPLGAFYAIFNKFSIYQYHVDQSTCIDCGKCARICKMDVDIRESQDHLECIRCGDCKDICPTRSISTSFTIKNKKRKAEEY